MYKIEVELPKSQELTLAWGDASKMTTDMVMFSTSFDGSVKDMFGTWIVKQSDTLNQYKNTIITTSSDKKTFNFITFRPPVSEDTFFGKDFSILCGAPAEEFTWELKPSGTLGSWTFATNKDCTLREEEDFLPEST